MRRIGVLLALVACSFALASAATAALIVEPAGRPFAVPANANGAPVAFTVIVSGFASGSPVYIEQCDGSAPSTPQWSPTANCDLASSPAAAIADAGGRATFDAHDKNRAFVAFVGDSPQGLFGCPPPGHCTLRVSSNNTTVTSDQVFLTLVLPSPHAGGHASQAASSSGTHASNTSTATAQSTAGAAAAGAVGAQSAGATTSASHHGGLAFTGAFTTVLAGIGLVCLGLGAALLSRRAERRLRTR